MEVRRRKLEEVKSKKNTIQNSFADHVRGKKQIKVGSLFLLIGG